MSQLGEAIHVEVREWLVDAESVCSGCITLLIALINESRAKRAGVYNTEYVYIPP